MFRTSLRQLSDTPSTDLNARRSGYVLQMSDDDWVGEPPEGRHSRDRADPGYWQRSWPVAAAAGAALFVLVVIVLILALT